MTKFIVRAFYNGTKLDFRVSAKWPHDALLRAQKKTLCRNAHYFNVIERKTGKLVFYGMNR